MRRQTQQEAHRSAFQAPWASTPPRHPFNHSYTIPTDSYAAVLGPSGSSGQRRAGHWAIRPALGTAAAAIMAAGNHLGN